MNILNDQTLEEAGLVLQGVLPTARVDLPVEANGFSQLLVFAHGGRRFWEYARSLVSEPDPEDDLLDHCAMTLAQDFMSRIDEHDYRILYPVDHMGIDLIGIGRELGWHHPSPMGIGIMPKWGTWFAYRVVIAANTQFEPTSHQVESPCETCSDRPCINACPAGAVSSASSFNLESCATYRMESGAACASQCLSRQRCPVASEHQYGETQIRYHYDRSLAALISYTA